MTRPIRYLVAIAVVASTFPSHLLAQRSPPDPMLAAILRGQADIARHKPKTRAECQGQLLALEVNTDMMATYLESSGLNQKLRAIARKVDKDKGRVALLNLIADRLPKGTPVDLALAEAFLDDAVHRGPAGAIRDLKQSLKRMQQTMPEQAIGIQPIAARQDLEYCRRVLQPQLWRMQYLASGWCLFSFIEPMVGVTEPICWWLGLSWQALATNCVAQCGENEC